MPPDLAALQKRFIDREFLLTAHASERAAERVILSQEIVEVMTTGEVIEDYPNDKYGPSCLIFGQT